MVRTNTTKLGTESNHVCKDFECGLACGNVEEASKLISEGEAALRISVYPWGAEFDMVTNGSGGGVSEENTSHAA